MLTMKNFLTIAASTLLTLFAVSVSAQSADNGRFLSLTPPDGLPIIPVLEGWIDNQDGTTSFSFGIINRNEEGVDIPLGKPIASSRQNGMVFSPPIFHPVAPLAFSPSPCLTRNGRRTCGGISKPVAMKSLKCPVVMVRPPMNWISSVPDRRGFAATSWARR